jgi:DNA-binding XRE family transcriptional regulator
MAKSKTAEKEHAKILYLHPTETLTQKEIAERVGVRPNTLSAWIEKGGWEKLRKSLLTTRQNMIGDLYDQLELLNREIKTRSIVYDVPANLLKPVKVKDAKGNETIEMPFYNAEDFPIKVGNYATSKEANQIAVLTSAIKKLETETSIAEMVEVSRDFLEWLKPQEFALYKKMLPFFDGFIHTKL